MRDSSANVFVWILQNFMEHVFTEHFQATICETCWKLINTSALCRSCNHGEPAKVYGRGLGVRHSLWAVSKRIWKSKRFGPWNSTSFSWLKVVYHRLLLPRKWYWRVSEICTFHRQPHPTIMFIKFWDLLMFQQTFFSPQLKRSVIISNKSVSTSCLRVSEQFKTLDNTRKNS